MIWVQNARKYLSVRVDLGNTSSPKQHSTDFCMELCCSTVCPKHLSKQLKGSVINDEITHTWNKVKMETLFFHSNIFRVVHRKGGNWRVVKAGDIWWLIVQQLLRLRLAVFILLHSALRDHMQTSFWDVKLPLGTAQLLKNILLSKGRGKTWYYWSKGSAVIRNFYLSLLNLC